jgi:hypothetical protein
LWGGDSVLEKQTTEITKTNPLTPKKTNEMATTEKKEKERVNEKKKKQI